MCLLVVAMLKSHWDRKISCRGCFGLLRTTKRWLKLSKVSKKLFESNRNWFPSRLQHFMETKTAKGRKVIDTIINHFCTQKITVNGPIVTFIIKSIDKYTRTVFRTFFIIGKLFWAFLLILKLALKTSTLLITSSALKLDLCLLNPVLLCYQKSNQWKLN